MGFRVHSRAARRLLYYRPDLEELNSQVSLEVKENTIMNSSENEPLLIEPSPDASSSEASLGFDKNPKTKTLPLGKMDKPPRKRSRIACTWCRDRKVRCDASSHGTPCTNCELDQQECVVHSASQYVNEEYCMVNEKLIPLGAKTSEPKSQLHDTSPIHRPPHQARRSPLYFNPQKLHHAARSSPTHGMREQLIKRPGGPLPIQARLPRRLHPPLLSSAQFQTSSTPFTHS